MADSSNTEFVDTHVHLWDLAGHAWYPALQNVDDAEHEVGLGDLGGLRRDYLLDDYRTDSARTSVTKIVHVSAVTAPRAYLQEAAWLDALAADTGLPSAVIGSVEPSAPAATIAADIDAQTRSPLFRGLRVLYGLDPTSDTAEHIASLLEERGALFEIVAHPSDAAGYAYLVQRHPGLTCVLEHAGWPEATDEAGLVGWRAAMKELAAAPNLHCKISGLPMALHSVEGRTLQPWFETCIETFGVGRCVIGSNFPIDRLYGTFDDLATAYRQLSSGLGADDIRRLWVTNAEALYRI